jgi:hypothetical protein
MNSIMPCPLSLAVQLKLLQRRFPEGEGSIVRSQLTWYQWIRPHALAHPYRCRLQHKLSEYPMVCCIEPALTVLAAGRKLPHVYTHVEPICLCLFRRWRECWNDEMSLANIVMPLAFFWLAQFEEWLYSGVWRGGGTHEIAPEPPTAVPEFPEEHLAK